MKYAFLTCKYYLVVFFLLNLFGCASNKSNDLTVDTYISARPTINPDINGEPRPINLSVYYLNDTEAFKQAGFFDLHGQAEETLGDSLLNVKHIQALPGSRQRVLLKAPIETKAVGIVAAFRNIDQSQWSDLILTPEKCFIRCKPGLNKEQLFIEIKRLSVTIETDGQTFKANEPENKTEEKTSPTSNRAKPTIKAADKLPQVNISDVNPDSFKAPNIPSNLPLKH